MVKELLIYSYMDKLTISFKGNDIKNFLNTKVIFTINNNINYINDVEYRFIKRYRFILCYDDHKLDDTDSIKGTIFDKYDSVTQCIDCIEDSATRFNDIIPHTCSFGRCSTIWTFITGLITTFTVT